MLITLRFCFSVKNNTVLIIRSGGTVASDGNTTVQFQKTW